MPNDIGARAQSELVGLLRARYRDANRSEMCRILDEFEAVAKCQKKRAVQLMGHNGEKSTAKTRGAGKRTYCDAVREALLVFWEASDRICGKWLKTVISVVIEAMTRDSKATVRARTECD